jgi:peptide/nickel transport system substrate-binding protein
MATDWEVSDDALTYTFKLREGVKFSDGSDFTAEDVVFTYETVKEKQAENENVDLTRLAKAEAKDDATVVFTLSEPYSPFLDTTAMLGVVPSDAYDAAAFDQAPIGTGPWKVVQYDANQQIIVQPNENYYEGAPSLSQVTFVSMESEAAFAAAQSGQLDIVMVNANYAGETVEGMHIQKFETMDVRMISLPQLSEQTMKDAEGAEIKVGNNVTSDKAVREALSIGIDRKAIIQNAFNGVGKPAVSFTDNLLWAAPAGYADGRADEAKALLESAGWTDADGDGVREKDGAPCAFTVYAPGGDQERYQLAAALAEDAKALGISIEVASASWDDVGTVQFTGGVVWGWGQYSPTVLESLYYSKNFMNGWSNVIGYDNSEVDALIASAIAATTQEEAITDWKAAQDIANADYPYLDLVNIEHCYFIADSLDVSLATQIPHPHGHGSPIICNMKDWKRV